MAAPEGLLPREAARREEVRPGLDALKQAIAQDAGRAGNILRDMADEESPLADYKDTLNLPETPFPMRGDLARRERSG